MTLQNLSRRAILAGAASVPALSLPAVVAAAPERATTAPVSATAIDEATIATAPDPDAKLLALGERLKAAAAEADKLDAGSLHKACTDAADYQTLPVEVAKSRFKAMAKQNGYDDAWKKWNAASNVEHKIATAILKMPANSRVGDGVRAFAALRLNEHDVDETTEAAEVLWGMAALAGFRPPAQIAKQLRRRGIVTLANHTPSTRAA